MNKEPSSLSIHVHAFAVSCSLNVFMWVIFFVGRGYNLIAVQLNVIVIYYQTYPYPCTAYKTGTRYNQGNENTDQYYFSQTNNF
jgi:hypothetical protein